MRLCECVLGSSKAAAAEANSGPEKIRCLRHRPVRTAGIFSASELASETLLLVLVVSLVSSSDLDAAV